MTRCTRRRTSFLVGASLLAASATTRAAPQPLTPVVEAFPQTGQAPLTVVFTGRNSTGKWGSASDIDTWEWDFTYDGQTLHPEASLLDDATVTFTYDRPGSYQCRLRITDQPNTGGPREAFINVQITVTASTRDPAQHSEYPPGSWGAGINHVWANADELAAAHGSFQPVDQIFMKWSQVEPDQQGAYDWTRLDKGLADAAAMGHRVSVQINSELPDWIFDHIAQTGTARGMRSPQFWDPDYIDTYLELITALGKHIADSPDGDRVLYVRQQWNAVHTETTFFDSTTDGDATSTWLNNPNWVWPSDAHRYEVEWTEDIARDYERTIIAHFLDTFGPLSIGVTLRAISSHLPENERFAYYQAGDPTAWLLITNNTYGKWDGGTQHRDEFIVMRSLGARGFEETWNDGPHRIPAKNPDLSPEQDIYGLVLRVLDVGLPYVGIYGSDLARAEDNEEFRKAFAFANRYAGWHLYPRSAPGAWIVLGRFEGSTQWRRLQTLTQDNWGFFLQQKDPAGTTTPVSLVGDPSCRFGLTARKLDATAAFDLDDGFAESIQGHPALLTVTYHSESGALDVQVDHQGTLQSLAETDHSDHKGWHQGLYALDDAEFSVGAGRETDITLVPLSGAPVVHSIELVRDGTDINPNPTDDGGTSPDGSQDGSQDGGASPDASHENGTSGCGCRSTPDSGESLCLIVGLILLMRRRRRDKAGQTDS